jgi:hypothetical protein
VSDEQIKVLSPNRINTSFTALSVCRRTCGGFNPRAEARQWVLHLITELPKDKRVLILAEGSSTVALICGFSCGTLFSDGFRGELQFRWKPTDLIRSCSIDPTVFGGARTAAGNAAGIACSGGCIGVVPAGFRDFLGRGAPLHFVVLKFSTVAFELLAMRHSAERESERDGIIS